MVVLPRDLALKGCFEVCVLFGHLLFCRVADVVDAAVNDAEAGLHQPETRLVAAAADEAGELDAAPQIAESLLILGVVIDAILLR